MNALTYHGDHNVEFESIADPAIETPGDALVKVKLCAICGSDLHVYHGREKGCDLATAMGHEFVGEIVDVGSEIQQLKKGDLVMSPFSTSCGQCEPCLNGLSSRCIHSQLFGWRQENKGLHGGQAEYVRVPFAEHTLMHIPPNLSLEQALLLGDVIPTGYFCAHQANIEPGKVYVVIGCGAVGLMAIVGAIALGATTVLAIDTLDERLVLAEQFGAIAIQRDKQNALQVIRDKTKGLGADGILEAVGSNKSIELAYQLVRPGGIISMVGVNTEPHLPFSPTDAYNKNLTLKVGRCPARFFMEKLLPMVAQGKVNYTDIISHRMALKDGSHGYALFAERRDHCTKVVLHC